MAQCGALQKLLENTRLAARSNIALASAAEFCANAGCECAVDLEKCSACLLNSEVLLETVSKCTLETAQETIRACESLQDFHSGFPLSSQLISALNQSTSFCTPLLHQ